MITSAVKGANGPSSGVRPRAGRLLTAIAASIALVLAPVTATSAVAAEPTAVVAPVDASITGSLVAGATVTVQTGAWTPADATLGYVWWQSEAPYAAPVEGVDQNVGAAVIPGAQTSQLTLDGTLVGRYVWAVVTGTSGALTPASVVAASSTAVTAPEMANVPDVSIQGTLTVGLPLTAVLSAAAPESAAVSYQWLRGGVPIDGATLEVYSTGVADADASLSVTATFTRDGYATATRTSPAVTVGKATLDPIPAAAMSGAVRVESPVTAVPGTWPAGTTFTYSWRIVDANGVETISKTTTATYAPTASTLRKSLSVVITGTVPGHNPASARSAAVTIAPGLFTSAPTPKISGAAYVGATLKVTAGTWSPAATLTYRWKRNGASISGATATTYKLTSADYGTKITVTVTAKRTGFSTTARTSVSTATVTKPFTTATAPKISGTVRAGNTLTAVVGTWSPTPSYSYQWKRDGIAVSGATGSTYALKSWDVGSKMTVTVTYKRSGYYTRVLTTAATAAVAVANTMSREGLFEVGVQIAPGTYYSTDTGAAGNDCYYERRSNGDLNDNSAALGWWFWWDQPFGGQKVVTITSADEYFYTEGCGGWKPVVTSIRTSVADGTWVVGKQIQTGVWQQTGTISSGGCVVEALGSFTGVFDNDYLGGWIDIGYGDQIYIDASVRGFMSDGCGTWVRVSA
ncbi:hypothetical protein [Microbacterium sp. CFBP9034]|uniref:hypothetical protein n=1 Tax=Microbacterium sp. CFBP9034 TaxID=3096540 RepID=UPI002A6B79B6|nr:hypothetical protein [Microbacterium sp. CFBP9034]MDY0910058.1 hypothetical protein [Microbacterium sp. CFBP9034]